METDAQHPFYRLQLLAIFLNALLVGLADDFVGPSLYDLQSVYDVDTKTITILLPVYAGCKLLGSFACFITQGRKNEYIQMAGSSLLAGVFISILPVLSTFWMAVMTIAFVGVFVGLTDSIGNVKGGQFAKDSVLPYHLLSFGFTTGNMAGPLFLFPFVDHNISNHLNDSLSIADRNKSEEDIFPTSQIGNGFVIITVSFIVSAVGFLVLHVILKRKQVTHVDVIGLQNEYSYWKRGFTTFTFVTTSLFVAFTSATTNIVYANLLPTFGIRGSLKEDPSTMALMTPLFTFVTLVGRLCGVILSCKIPQISCCFSSLVGVLVSSLILFFTGELSQTHLWVGTSLLALFYAPVYGYLLTWTEQIVPLSSTYLILMTFLDNAGLSFLSLIIGQLMTVFYVNFLNISMIFIAVIQLISFLTMYILSHHISHDVNPYTDLESPD